MSARARVVWTHHAARRVAERFGERIEVPYRSIQRGAAVLGRGARFLVKTSSARFVCMKKSDSVVLVVTVYGR